MSNKPVSKEEAEKIQKYIKDIQPMMDEYHKADMAINKAVGAALEEMWKANND